jgi:glucan 1,3-beta-glucosidase
MNTVRQFYMDGWGNLKDSNVAITFHDAFQGVTGWNSWGAGMWNLLLDTHHYEIFDNSIVSQDLNSHIKTACDFGNQMASTGKWTIAGEFTGGITDCAKWLNGKDKGARYDGTLSGSSKVGDCAGKYTGSVAAMSSEDKNNVGRFIEAQLDAYEKATGWIFWTWKTEGAPEWDMQDLLANGIFPSPVTSRKCKNPSPSSSVVLRTNDPPQILASATEQLVETDLSFLLFPCRHSLRLAKPATLQRSVLPQSNDVNEFSSLGRYPDALARLWA